MLNMSDMGSAKDQGFKSFAYVRYCTLLGPMCVWRISQIKNGHSNLNHLHHESLFIKCQLGNCDSSKKPLWLFMLAYRWPRQAGSHPNSRGKHLLMRNELPLLLASCAYNAHRSPRPRISRGVWTAKEELSSFFIMSLNLKGDVWTWRACRGVLNRSLHI